MMHKSAIFTIALLTLGSAQANDPFCGDSTNRELLDCIGGQYQKQTHLDYTTARKHMFTDFDNENGFVTLVYSGDKFRTDKIPNHKIVNTEHTWHVCC